MYNVFCLCDILVKVSVSKKVVKNIVYGIIILEPMYLKRKNFLSLE